MKFETLQRTANILSKTFAEDILRLLVLYKTISASEAASRLDLHIKTVQDVLEEMSSIDITGKEEVYERKRPYYRYYLKNVHIKIDFDLRTLNDHTQDENKRTLRIREKKNSGAIFSTASGQNYLSSVIVYSGEGRNRNERRLSFTRIQGTFLFHLPFPTAEYKSIEEILVESESSQDSLGEILDIVDILIELGVIEKQA